MRPAHVGVDDSTWTRQNRELARLVTAWTGATASHRPVMLARMVNSLDELQHRLADGAVDLFVQLAAIHVAAGTGVERRFLLVRTFGGTFLRPAFAGGKDATFTEFDAGWLDDMASVGLLSRVLRGKGEFYRVTPLGERFYDRRLQLAGEAIEQVQIDVLALVNGDAFAQRHPVVGERLTRILGKLRSGNQSADTIREIGLDLRHVLMDIAAEADPSGDPEKPVDRLEVLKRQLATTSEERQAAAASALIDLVAAVLRLNQGAAHIKQRPDRIETFDDLRRAVFLTVVAVYEIDTLLWLKPAA